MAGNGKAKSVAMPDRFGLVEARRRDFVLEVEKGTPIERLLDPDYWAHVAVQFGPYDMIEARSEDGAWIAYLRVLYSERNFAKVIMEREPLLITANTDQPPEKEAPFKVEWKGPVNKYAVIRNTDSEVLQKGFATRDDASAWMQQHVKAMQH